MTRLRPAVLSLALAACSTGTPDPLSGCTARDDIDVIGVSVEGSTLNVSYGHSDGCAQHTYSICWDGSIAESDPPQVRLVLWHDDGGETCEAYTEGTYSVDIQSILDATGGTVDLSVDGQRVLVGGTE